MISSVQLDPFGFCNSKCFFCPVRYYGNPDIGRTTMPKDLLEKIVNNILEEKGRLVDAKLWHIYTAHYNEILLYKHLEFFLNLFSQNKLATTILTNGTPLTKRRMDLLLAYRPAIAQIVINMPAYTPTSWAKATGFMALDFAPLVAQLCYAFEQCAAVGISMSIVCNWPENSNTVQVGKNVSEYDERSHEQVKELFGNVPFVHIAGLSDRASLIPSTTFSNILPKNKRVIGCNNMATNGLGRPESWLHINARGKAFLCCNDFYFDHVFGDFVTQKLADFWNTPDHLQVVSHARNTICSSCNCATFDQ